MKTAARLRIFVLILSLICQQRAVFAQTEASSAPAFTPNFKPVLEVHPAGGPITIDGNLDDPGWQGAAVADNFAEVFPGDLTRPPIAIRALLTYDKNYLYVAFQIQDDPSRIRYALRDRDRIYQDDFVGIMLDPFGQGAWAYELFVNPLGIQGELLRTESTGEDPSFDLVFKSKGRITDTGYQVEMAIPFRSLRFPGGEEQTWRMHLIVNHPRDSRRQYTWAAISRDDPCILCQMGYLKGIRGVHRGRQIELLPALVCSQSSEISDRNNPDSGFKNGAVKGEPAFSLKYGISSTSVLDFTLNPDFSQVEADADQVDVNTTFALFFPEKRPFFQEGTDLYRSWINAVYTRTINDPIAASKLTLRHHKVSLGFIGAVDEHTPIIMPFEEQSGFLQLGRSYASVFRLKQTFGEDNYLGVLLTDRRLTSEGYNTTAGIDLRWQLRGKWRPYRLEAQWMFSRTGEPQDTSLSKPINGLMLGSSGHSADFDGEILNGHAAYLNLVREGRHLQLRATYREFSPTFRADNGFITQNNVRKLFLRSGYVLYPSLSFIDQLEGSIMAGRTWNFDGLRKDEWIMPRVDATLKAQTNLSISFLISKERFRGQDFPGIRRLNLGLQSQAFKSLFFGFYTTVGRSIARTVTPPVLGRFRSITLFLTLQPSSRLTIDMDYQYNDMRWPDQPGFIFSGYIWRTRVNYQFNRQLFLRVFAQYNHFSRRLQVDPLLTFKLNAFSAFFLGSSHQFNRFGDGNALVATSRQFFMKFQYLFRL